MLKEKYKTYFLYISAITVGLLLGAPFLHPALNILIFLGVFSLLSLIEKNNKSNKLFFLLLLTFTTKSIVVLSWFWAVYPIGWLTSATNTGVFFTIFVVWATVAISIALGNAGILFFYAKFLTKRNWLIWLFPFFYSIAEIAGSLTFSLYSIGPGSVPNIHFTFGYIGYALGTTKWFDGITTVGGIYGLSLICSLCVIIVYQGLQQKHTATCVTAAVFLLFGVIFSHANVTHSESANLRIIALETNFSSSDTVGDAGHRLYASQIESATKAALQYKPDFLILPEDSRLTSLHSEFKDIFKLIETYSSSTILIDSARTSKQSSDTILRGFMYGPENNLIVHDKQYLVPIGEFVPYLANLPLKYLSSTETYSEVKSRLQYTAGSLRAPNNTKHSFPALAFCIEGISPLLIKKLSLKYPDAPFVAHLVSHAWFHDQHILNHQLNSMHRVGALWSHKTIIGATNNTGSYAIGSNGEPTKGKQIESSLHWKLIEYSI